MKPRILQDPRRRFEIQLNSTGISRASFLVEQNTAPKISLPVIISHNFNQTLIYWITAHGQQFWNILCNHKYLENVSSPLHKSVTDREESSSSPGVQQHVGTGSWSLSWTEPGQGQQWTCHENSVTTNAGNKDSQGNKKAFSFFLILFYFYFLIKIVR